jgi:hypothetical protein
MPGLQRLIRMLKAECPTITVHVRTCRVRRGIMGECQRKEDRFIIRIAKGLSHQAAADTIVHEFAHADSWLEWENTEQHGPLWGVSHAKMYRVYERWISGAK